VGIILGSSTELNEVPLDPPVHPLYLDIWRGLERHHQGWKACQEISHRYHPEESSSRNQRYSYWEETSFRTCHWRRAFQEEDTHRTQTPRFWEWNNGAKVDRQFPLQNGFQWPPGSTLAPTTLLLPGVAQWMSSTPTVIARMLWMLLRVDLHTYVPDKAGHASQAMWHYCRDYNKNANHCIGMSPA